jgi:tetratricopeptide (TPR) repeat protein
LTEVNNLPGGLCPQCRRPLSAAGNSEAVVTLDLPQPGLAQTLVKSLPATPLDTPAPALTLDLPGPTPPVAPSARETPVDTSRIDRLGRFTIIRFLGEGGFGRVYEAHDPQLDRRIALKVARPERLADDRSMALFMREARAAGNLRHPHIIAVFDSGKDGPHYFIASAFIEGKSLDKHLSALPEGQTFPFRKSVILVRQLAEALAYAHGRGVVHRDIKPANIMIDEQGQPLLMDFGLAARAVESEAKPDEQRSMGTPAYMAPEQGHGKAESASDQYSLGCTLYELLTGRTPFGGSAEIQVFLHQTQPPPRLRQVNPVVPLDLEAICLRCLHKEPSQRYANCQELADDVRRWLEREPVRARRVGPIERSIKWARRKPFQAVSVLFGLLLVAVFSFAGWREARDYRLKYERQNEATKYLSARETDYLDARKLADQKQWVEAASKLEGIEKGLEARTDLEADDLLERVKESLADVRRHIEEDNDRQKSLSRWQAFQAPYRDAVFTQVSLTSRGAHEDRAKTRASARKALKYYGLDGENSVADASGSLDHPVADASGSLEHDRRLLPPAAFDRLTAECYELLLIWADVEATDQADRNEPKAAARQRGAKALALLERARALGKAYKLRTQTYHIRKARYQALAREENASPTPADPDTPAEPTGALDWFFRGLESYQQAEQIEEAGRQAKYREASVALEQAVRDQPDHFWAYYLQGLCQLRLGRWREARVVLTICLNLQPANFQREFPWPRVQRGFAAAEQGARLKVQAEQLTKRAIQERRLLERADTLLSLLREMESEFALARTDLDHVLNQPQLDKEARYAGLVNRGVLYIHQKQWDNAIADLKQAIAVDPAAYQAHVNLANALYGGGRRQEALAAISRAIDRAPQFPQLYLERAQMHLAQKKREAALADYKRAIAHEPAKGRSLRLAETFVKVGRLLLEEREYHAALEQFERALKASPELVLTERFRATALLGLHRKEDAAAALDRYLALTPDPVPEALQARGLLYAEKGGADRLRLAIQLYSAALRLKPQDTKTRGHRAWAYLESGANRLALDDFKICRQEQPRSADYLTGCAAARVRLRQVSEAVADAEAVEKMGGLTDRLCYHLSCVYAQAAAQAALVIGSGRNRHAEQALARYENKALLHLERVMEEQPAHERARFWRERVEKDPALAGIRSGRTYFALARKYGAETRAR